MATNVSPTRARDDYLRNKAAQQYNSRAKTLLYGGDERAPTPVHVGKKSVPHPGDHGSAPFATSSKNPPGDKPAVQGGQMAKTFQAKSAKKEGAGKISSMEYGSDVYKQQLIDSHQNLAAQKNKAWGSSGLLRDHPKTPQADPYAELDEYGNPIQHPVPQPALYHQGGQHPQGGYYPQ